MEPEPKTIVRPWIWSRLQRNRCEIGWWWIPATAPLDAETDSDILQLSWTRAPGFLLQHISSSLFGELFFRRIDTWGNARNLQHQKRHGKLETFYVRQYFQNPMFICPIYTAQRRSAHLTEVARRPKTSKIIVKKGCIHVASCNC